MIKSLLLILVAALPISASASATEARYPASPISSGRSVGHDAREAWFRRSVGDILEGRAISPSRRERSR